MDGSGRLYYVKMSDKSISWQHPDEIKSSALESSPRSDRARSAADFSGNFAQYPEHAGQHGGIRAPEASQQQARLREDKPPTRPPQRRLSTAGTFESGVSSSSTRVHEVLARGLRLNYPDFCQMIAGCPAVSLSGTRMHAFMRVSFSRFVCVCVCVSGMYE